MDEVTKMIGNELKLSYNLAQAIDILINSIERRTKKVGGLKQEKKKAFKQFTDLIRSASYWFDRAFEKDLEKATCGEYKKLDGYRQDANELIRILMLYIDRTTTYDSYKRIVDSLKNMPEGGVFSENDIKRYEFYAKYRQNSEKRNLIDRFVITKSVL